MKLKGKTAVITGASTGIGKAIALVFAQEGAEVIVNYNRSQESALQVVAEISQHGGIAKALQADLSKPNEIKRLVDETYKILGKIDIWANIAGADILTGIGALLSDQDKLDALINVDLLGTMYCCWEIAPRMQQAGHGVIINMSWDLAIEGMAGRNPEIFAAIKAGIHGFTKCLARSYAPEVRVNDLAPGWIATAFAQEVMRKEYYEKVVANTPLRRFGTPEDVAHAALYLASDNAAFITGQTLRINGGVCG